MIIYSFESNMIKNELPDCLTYPSRSGAYQVDSYPKNKG